jgi:hypothetical protein
MSTRALYTIIDADTKAKPAEQSRYGLRPAVKASKGDAWNVYIHGDGYPTGAADYVLGAQLFAWDLPRFEADEFAAALCASAKQGIKGGNARFLPQGKPLEVAARHCADIQYRYEIRATGVKVYGVDAWECKPKQKLLFACPLTKFKAAAAEYEKAQEELQVAA